MSITHFLQSCILGCTFLSLWWEKECCRLIYCNAASFGAVSSKCDDTPSPDFYPHAVPFHAALFSLEELRKNAFSHPDAAELITVIVRRKKQLSKNFLSGCYRCRFLLLFLLRWVFWRNTFSSKENYSEHLLSMGPHIIREWWMGIVLMCLSIFESPVFDNMNRTWQIDCFSSNSHLIES